MTLEEAVDEYHQRHPGPESIDARDIAEYSLIHASLTWAGQALCATGGALAARPRHEAVLALDHPLAAEHRFRVNCSGCLEWLHA